MTAPTGWTLFLANNIQDASGKLLAQGTLEFLPTDSTNRPLTVTVGSPTGGAILTQAAPLPVFAGSVGPANLPRGQQWRGQFNSAYGSGYSAGDVVEVSSTFYLSNAAANTDTPGGSAKWTAISGQMPPIVPDTALTRPANMAIRVTVKDATGADVFRVPYVYPTGPSFNFDTFQPNVGSQAVVQTGPPGLSAYQEWLGAGNVGTLAQFLATLQGTQGIPGPKGDAGTTTLTGSNGDFTIPGLMTAHRDSLTDTYLAPSGNNGGFPLYEQSTQTAMVAGPGHNSGNSGGWSITHGHATYLYSSQRGIGQGLVIDAHKVGVGDFAGFYAYARGNVGVTAGSDEGYVAVQGELYELANAFNGTVSSTAGTGDTKPVFTFGAQYQITGVAAGPHDATANAVTVQCLNPPPAGAHVTFSGFTNPALTSLNNTDSLIYSSNATSFVAAAGTNYGPFSNITDNGIATVFGNNYTIDGATMLNLSKGTLSGTLTGSCYGLSGYDASGTPLNTLGIQALPVAGVTLPLTTAWGFCPQGIPFTGNTRDLMTSQDNLTMTLGSLSAPVTFAATTVTGSPNLNTSSSIVGVAAGQHVTGAGIPAGATVLSVSGTTVVISANATVTSVGAISVAAVSIHVAPFVVGPAVLGGCFNPEQVTINYVGPVVTSSSGVQTQVVNLTCSNPNGQFCLFQGGIAGQYISPDANLAFSGQRGSYPALGSLTGTDLIYWVNVAGNEIGPTYLPMVGNEAWTPTGPNSAWHLYPGCEIVANRVPITPTGTNAFDCQLEQNNIQWQPGDRVCNPDYPIQGGHAAWFVLQSENPTHPGFGKVCLEASYGGHGISASMIGFLIRNGNPTSYYQTWGGPLGAPTGLAIQGPHDNPIFIEYGPAPSRALVEVGAVSGNAQQMSLLQLPVEFGFQTVVYDNTDQRYSFPGLKSKDFISEASAGSQAYLRCTTQGSSVVGYMRTTGFGVDIGLQNTGATPLNQLPPNSFTSRFVVSVEGVVATTASTGQTISGYENILAGYLGNSNWANIQGNFFVGSITGTDDKTPWSIRALDGAMIMKDSNGNFYSYKSVNGALVATQL